MTSTFEHGVKEGVCQHSHIVKHLPYSNFISFVTKARVIFHAEFKRYHYVFPGVHAEVELRRPLWLHVDDPKYGKMVELGRIVKVGFTP